MSNLFVNRPRRRRLLAGAACLLVLLITVVVALIALPHPQRTGASPLVKPSAAGSVPTGTAAVQPPSSAPTTGGPASGGARLSGPVPLLRGARMVDGVALGFPRTTLGAIGAASEDIADLASELDPARAAAIMRLVTDSSAVANPSLAAQSAVKLRQALQLPTSGPLPVTVSFTATPQMYQLRDVSSDRVTVLVLCTLAYLHGGGAATTTGVYPMHMHWDPSAGDWRLVAVGGPSEDYSSLQASPGSTDATAKGWQPLTLGT